MNKYKKHGQKKLSAILHHSLIFSIVLSFVLLSFPVETLECEEPPPGIKLLIADFANNTGDPDLAKTIKPVLHWTLEESDRLDIYPEIKAQRFLSENFEGTDDGMTISRARRLCLSENIPVILVPGINSLEGSLIISAKLIYIKENRELFVDTLRVRSLDQLAITLENLSKRIRQSLGESWKSPAMTGEIFSKDTTFEIMDLFSRSFSFYAYTGSRDAIERLENILARDPDLAIAQLCLGALYFRIQKPRDALLYISKAKDNSSNLPLKYRYLIDGLHDFLNHRYREATARFRSYANAFPYDWQAFSLLGRCEAVLGNYPAAVEEFRKAVSLNDTRIESYIDLSLGLLYSRDSIAARRILDQASMLAPEDPGIKISLGLVELVENNPRFAIQAFEQTLQLPLFRSRSTMLIAQSDIYRGKFKDALDLLAAGIEEDRKNRDAFAEASKRLARAQIYQLTGNMHDAVAECRRIPDTIDDPVLLAEKGFIFAGAGSPAEAEEILQRMRTIPSFPFIQALEDRLLGEIQSVQGRLKEAEQSFLREKEITRAPSLSLARILMQAEQWKRAAAEFVDIRDQKAAMLFPYYRPWFAGTWVQALYDAGRCSLKLDHVDNAKQYFRQYLWVMESADPSFETPREAEILLTGRTLKR